jgi:hypothetical protein
MDILTSANILSAAGVDDQLDMQDAVMVGRVELCKLDCCSFGLAIRLWNVLLHFMQVAGTPQKVFESKRARESLDGVFEGFRKVRSLQNKDSGTELFWSSGVERYSMCRSAIKDTT